MMNHALFAGLLHAEATPITDNRFHSQALSHKLKRVASEPAIHQAISDRAAQRQFKADTLAASSLMDAQIQLPILDPALPLAEVLEYRQTHAGDLQQARENLGWMARRIRAEPWSTAFAMELEHKTIPDIAKELEAVRKARDSWLKSERGRLALKAAGLATGAAAAVLAVCAAPATPFALAANSAGAIFRRSTPLSRI